MATTQYYDLSLIPDSSIVKVHASQWDDGERKFVFTLYDENGLYTIPSGAVIALRATKADRHGYAISTAESPEIISYSGSEVTIVTEKQMCAAAGEQDFKLSINISGKVIASARYTLVVDADTLDDADISDSYVPEIIGDATQQMENAEAWAVGKRGGVDVGSSDETYHNNAKYYANQSEQSAERSADAEAWAVGQRGGVDVESSDDTYHNNAKYYSEEAERIVAGESENAEAWAVGQRGGVDVGSSDETYHNNAKYYSNEAQRIVEDESQKAEAWAVGQRDGVDVPSTDPQYHNNAKYYSEEAERIVAGESENAEAWAVGQRSGVDVGSSDETYHNNAKYYSEETERIGSEKAKDAEAWAVGKRNGVDVGSSDETYHNNAKYYSQESERIGTEKIKDAEAWAKGTRDGVDVPSTDPQYHNNAKYYANQSAYSAGTSADAEAWAVGQRGGVDVPSTDPQYHNSAKYYYEQTRSISQGISGALKPRGTCTFANLPSIASSDEGDMWNISDGFTTTSDFKEGAGHKIEAGRNVYLTSDGKWDILAGTDDEFVGATANANGIKGNVPQPLAGDEDKVLQGKGSWGKKLQVDIVVNNGVCGYVGENNTFIPFKSQADIDAAVSAAMVGDATAADVLFGKTFTNSNTSGVQGAMTNNGAVSQSLDANTTSYTIPSGYHSGQGIVSVTTQEKTVIPSSQAQIVTPDAGKLLSKVTVNASAGSLNLDTVKKSPMLIFDWTEKTWSGLTSFDGRNVWTDGNNIYYSSSSSQYVLDVSTSTWTAKTWSGLTSFDGRNVWTDGNNIYYSNAAKQYVLNGATSTWSAKTWSGLTSFDGSNVWTDGNNIYYSNAATQYVLNVATSTWSEKVWNEYSSIKGEYIWTDGKNIFFTGGYANNQYVLDVSTSTWTAKTWSGYATPLGSTIWTDGANINLSNANKQYVLEVSTSTWIAKSWSNLSSFSGNYIWTDGNNIYFSNSTAQYVLNKKRIKMKK